MEQMNFLNNVLVFIGFISLAVVTINWKRDGRILGFFFNLVASLAFFGMLFQADQFQLSELVVIEGNKVLLLKITAFLNILMMLLNGHENHEKVKSAIIINFMFLGSVFLLGATELITFYVALETIALLGYALVSLSNLEFSKEAAVKYLIQGAVISTIFLLGVAFYLGGTGSLDLTAPQVINHQLYAIAVGIFIMVTFFKLGAFPFHAWMADVYSNVTSGNLATNFFVSKIIVGFKFFIILQVLIPACEPQFQNVLIKVIQLVAVVSAFYGNIIAVVQKQWKRIIAYSSLAHTGYMLMAVALNPDEAFEKQLISFLVLYSLTATGVILILNQFAQIHKGRDYQSILISGFYKNKVLSVLLIIFVLSLAGIPLTSGFALKYMLFTNFFKEGFTIEAVAILISSIIGLSYYIKFVADLFVESEEKMSLPVIRPSYGEQLVHLIAVVAIITIGIVPALFFQVN
ncbi:MAG: hypothetical protein L6Q33_05260 [Bacteriovoracaceae bacterium]|jgi:NADH-quinone oxidoreductase subunit N|nr:hypothetical protein [Bacteriovoracaceae bacterium]